MKELLKLLGVSTEAEAIVAVAGFNTYLKAIQAVGGDTDNEACLAAFRDRAKIVASVEELTGKKGAEAMGVITAWKTANDRADKAEATLAKNEKTTLDASAKALIDELIDKGRVEPAKREAAENMYAKFGMDGLKAYADSLPQGTINTVPEPDGPTPPNSPKQGAISALDASQKAVAHALGLDDAEMLESLNSTTATLNGAGESQFTYSKPAA